MRNWSVRIASTTLPSFTAHRCQSSLKNSTRFNTHQLRATTPNVEKRAQEAAELERKQELGYETTESRTGKLARSFPLAAVVGQDMVKQALLLGAVDNGLGGISISGRRGTAKSIMARGIHALLPPIEVVEGSWCNADPNDPRSWENDLKTKLAGKEFKTFIRDAPFVQIPLGVTEDRLLGTVDIEESVKQGKTVFQPGLLAEAHRGILYVDEINLLDDGICNLLLSTLSDGVNVVEREGLSVSHPCKPLLVATYNPEEGKLREHLLDRFAISISADVQLTMEQRIEAVDIATLFQNLPTQILDDTEETTEATKTQILIARESLNEVQITDEQVAYLVEEASRGLVEGHRSEIFAVRAAKAAAALQARNKVQKEDLELAVQLVILPRALLLERPPDEDQNQPPPPPPPPPSSDQDPEDDQQDEQEDNQEDPEDSPQQIPEEFVFESEGVILDPNLLLFAQAQQRAQGRAGRAKMLIFSDQRGRYIKPMFPKGSRVTRLAVDATIRAAAPYQNARRNRATTEQKETKSVYIEKGDLRSKKLARKAGALVMFVVDASGSMALNRMSAAKGAAMRILTESYTNRDLVCLIPFYGDKADVLLPPSKSVSMARRRLDALPCGGGSPLAHGLSTAIRVALNHQQQGNVGRVMVVLITDGRANVSLAKSNEDPDAMDPNAEKPSQEELRAEVTDMAKKMFVAGIQLLVIDTENKFVSTGFAEEIAKNANGKYYYLPNASDKAIASATSLAMAETKDL
eukprot:g5430.t1